MFLYTQFNKTIGCRNNAILYDMILRTSLQFPMHIINQSVNPKRHPIPCPNGRAMGCRLWGVSRKLTALKRHYIVHLTFRFNQLLWHGLCLRLMYKPPTRQTVAPPCHYNGAIWVLADPISPANQLINTLRPRQNGRHFADDILKSTS